MKIFGWILTISGSLICFISLLAAGMLDFVSLTGVSVIISAFIFGLILVIAGLCSVVYKYRRINKKAHKIAGCFFIVLGILGIFTSIDIIDNNLFYAVIIIITGCSFLTLGIWMAGDD